MAVIVLHFRPMATSLAERIEEGTVFDANGCRVWCGGARKGYGRIRYRGVKLSVHRVAWEMVNGAIPDGLVVDHTCRNRRCCRVEHLRVVTPRQNSLENSNSRQSTFARMTCCPKCGGELTPRRWAVNARECVPCRDAMSAEAGHKYRAANREKTRASAAKRRAENKDRINAECREKYAEKRATRG